MWGPKDRFLKHVTWLNSATTRPIWVWPGSVSTIGRLSGTRGGFCSDRITVNGETIVGAYESVGAL